MASVLSKSFLLGRPDSLLNVGIALSESHYKYQIKKWDLKKSIPKAKKEALCRVVKSREQRGKSSKITRGGQAFDTKNVVRYLKSQLKDDIALRPAAEGQHGNLKWPSVHFCRQFGSRM